MSFFRVVSESYPKLFRSRLILCLSALALGLALQGHDAQAADSVFEVAKIFVDSTAKDAVAAKQKGMAEAEQRAFQTVLKRLVPLSATAQLPTVGAEDVSSLVTGVAIRSEQYSTTRYIATLDISFSAPGVKRLLQSYGVAFSEAQAPALTVLPIVIDKNAVRSSGPEDWRGAWEALDTSHSMTPATIVNPRAELTVETANAILGGDTGALATLQSQYGDRPLVVAEAKVADGKFVMRLVGEDSAGNINYVDELPLDGRNAKTVAREAAEIAFGILENRWKVTQSSGGAPQPTQTTYGEEPPVPGAEPAAPGEVPRNLAASVEFSGLKDWQDIRARLMNVPGLQALEVNSLSARSAAVTFEFAGSLGRLQSELGSIGFSLEDRDGTFVVRAR
jgi:hypothetical protein